MAVHETLIQRTLEVYPDPVSDVLYIKNLPCEAVDYAIFNMLGQRVADGFSCGAISVAELEKGFYLLQVMSDGFLETVKFIVK